MNIGDKIIFIAEVRNNWGQVVFRQDQIATVSRLVPLMADDRWVPPDATYTKVIYEEPQNCWK